MVALPWVKLVTRVLKVLMRRYQAIKPRFSWNILIEDGNAVLLAI